MIGLPSGTRVWIVAGRTDMRKGFDGLAALVQTALAENPFKGNGTYFGALTIAAARKCLMANRGG